MPIPKGINTPAVRAARLEDRCGKLAEFDRLVAEGLSKPKAARHLGISSAGVEAMRRSVELMERGGSYGPGTAASSIDLGLALLSVLRQPGEYLTCEDIAAWCDCSRGFIQRIEARALRKVRRRMNEALRSSELGEEVEELLARLTGTAALS